MRAPALGVLVVAVIAGSAQPAIAQRADLAKARTFYNQRQFDEAIEAAQVAQKEPVTAEAATVVLARANVERISFRT